MVLGILDRYFNMLPRFFDRIRKFSFLVISESKNHAPRKKMAQVLKNNSQKIIFQKNLRFFSSDFFSTKKCSTKYVFLKNQKYYPWGKTYPKESS